MVPTVTSLLCLGLCLSQKTTAREGTLPRPFLRIMPSSVVSKGTVVSFCCQGSQGSKTFQLWKDGGFLIQMNSSKEEVNFRFPLKDPPAAGDYSCRYSQGPLVSDFSAPLQLVVTGFFSKPSLQVQPGTVVTVGETVTLVCQVLRSSIRKLTFFLLKAGVPAPLQHQRVEGQRANFTLPSVKAEEAGNYSCVYSEQEGRKRASDPSEVLSLEVTESGVVLIATVCCASVFFLLLLLCLLVFLFRHHTQHKSSHGDTPRRPSENPHTLCLTSLSPKEIMYEDVSKGRQVETWAFESEDPQGVTYSQLNTAALDEGQRAPTSVLPQPSIYATLALH